MFKRTGWFATQEAHASKCGCGETSNVFGPYDSDNEAAEDARELGYVAGEVIFFDWDSPPGVIVVKQEIWMGSMPHRAALLTEQFGQAADYLGSLLDKRST